MAWSIDSPAVSVQRRWSASAILGWAAFLVGMLPVGIMMIGGGLLGMAKPAWWASFPGAAWGSALVLGFVALMLRAATRPRPGRVAVTGDAVAITKGDAVFEVRKGEIVEGAIAPEKQAPSAAIRLADGRTFTIRTRSIEEADGLLRSIAIEPEKRRFATSFDGGVVRGLLGVAVVFALALATGLFKRHIGGGIVQPFAGIVWLAIAIPSIAAWLLGTRPPEIVVGADGVTIRRAVQREFVSFREIASVSLERSGARSAAAIVLTLRDGRAVRVPIPLGNDEAAAALAWRIQLGLAAAAEQADAPARLALLHREGRTIQDWRRRLEGVAGADAGYRAVPLSQPDLEAILAAPSSTVEQRLGAALALRALGRRDARAPSAAPKLRIAAEQCASPRLRVALGKLAEDGEEAAIDEAVAEALAEEGAGHGERRSA